MRSPATADTAPGHDRPEEVDMPNRSLSPDAVAYIHNLIEIDAGEHCSADVLAELEVAGLA